MKQSTKVQHVFEVQDERGVVRTFHQTKHTANSGRYGYTFVGRVRIYGLATDALFHHAATGRRIARFFGRGKHAHLVERLPLTSVPG